MQAAIHMHNIGHRAGRCAPGYSRGRQGPGLPFALPPQKVQNGATHTLFVPGGYDADSRVRPRHGHAPGPTHLGVRCGLSLGLQKFGRHTRLCEDALLTV